LTGAGLHRLSIALLHARGQFSSRSSKSPRIGQLDPGAVAVAWVGPRIRNFWPPARHSVGRV